MRSPSLRPLLFLVIATLATGFVSAQPVAEKVRVKVRMSPEKAMEAKLRPYSVIRSDQNSIMVLRSGDFDVHAFGTFKSTVEVYDREKLMRIRSMEPVLERSGHEKLFIENLVYFAGRPMLIARGGEEAVRLYYQPLDPNLAKLAPSFERFCEFPMEMKAFRPVAAQKGVSIRQPFQTAVSKDSTKLLVYSPEIRDPEGDEGAFYLLTVVDANMHVLWNNILRIPDETRLSEVMDAEVDNMGNAFILLKSDLGEGMEGKPNMDIALHRLANGDISQVPIPLGSSFVVGAMLRALENDRVACAGIYASSEGGTITAGGNFLAVFDSTSTALGEPLLMPFSGENSFTFEGDPGELDDEKQGGKADEEEGKKMKRIAVNDDVIAMLPRKDGGFFLVNEVNVINERRDSETGRVSKEFHFGPVQARSFDKDGHEQWSTFFRRWSSSDSPLLGSVFCVDFDNKLFLFLLDTEEMAENRKSGAPITAKDTQKPFSAYVAFDEKGAFKAKPVLRGESGSDFIAGSQLVRFGANEYIALGTDNLISSHFLPVKIEISYETKK